MKPLIPLKRSKEPVRQDRQPSEEDGSIYRIFDENDNPLVLDLAAIDECQKRREHIPPDVIDRTSKPSNAAD